MGVGEVERDIVSLGVLGDFIRVLGLRLSFVFV